MNFKRVTTHYTRTVCKKVKVSLCLIKFYAMQAYGVVEAKRTTKALYRDDSSR
jgi:hypothetical protein